uniref:Uncharacterized protein n=1 Tax=Klebsiella pneumoniae TaxID=573 RepID=A0A8B0ST54_KLEPN|nr:hypothetical protein [Klebsiella pneumoniae]
MVKALLGSERSMLSEICKISQSMQLNLLNFRRHFFKASYRRCALAGPSSGG